MKHFKLLLVIWGSLSIMIPAFAEVDEYLEQPNYRGAFGGSNWAAGWSGLSEYGVFAMPTEMGGEIVTVTDGDIQAGEIIYWTADKIWLLDGRVFVDDKTG